MPQPKFDIIEAIKNLDLFLESINPTAFTLINAKPKAVVEHGTKCLRDLSYYYAIKGILLNLDHSGSKPSEASELLLQPVLTAHPTEPLSDVTIESIISVLDDNAPNEKFKKILSELFSKPLTPLHKLTVEDEVKRNLKWFSRVRNFAQGYNLKIRSWAGGDADGNPKVDVEATKQAIHLHSSKKYSDEKLLIDVRQNSYIHSIIVAEILEKVEQHLDSLTQPDNYEIELLKLLQKFHYIDLVISTDDPLQLAQQKEQKRVMLLDILLSQKKIFEIIKSIERTFYSSTIMELDRIKLIHKHGDIIENYIISGCEHFSDILQLQLLLNLHPTKVSIVPLFESKNAIESGDLILSKAFNNSHYQNSLKNLTQKVMIGFSDSEKESGLMVLPLIEIAIEKMKRLCFNHGITLEVFYGNGLDIGRGGPSIIKTEQTIQGNHLRYNFSTKANTLNYFNSIIRNEASCLITSGNQDEKFALLRGVEASTKKFETLWQPNCFLYALEHYLHKASPFFLFVRTNNFSSRPSKRNTADSYDHPYAIFFKTFNDTSDLTKGIRAISWVNTIEGTFTNFNLWYGLYDGLLKIKETIDPKILFENNSIFRDICIKALSAIELADFELAWEYFPKTHRPTSKEHITTLSNQCNNKKGQKNTSEQEFLAMLQVEFEMLKSYFIELGISLPENIKLAIHGKKEALKPANEMMAYFNRKIIFEGQTVTQVLGDISEDEFFEIAGALYVAFTEYRTPVKV